MKEWDPEKIDRAVATPDQLVDGNLAVISHMWGVDLVFGFLAHLESEQSLCSSIPVPLVLTVLF